jgi:hypothetical protein
LSYPFFLVSVIATNLGCQATRATKLCTVAPSICGSSVWNLVHVTIPMHRSFSWLLYFWKICAPLSYQSQSLVYYISLKAFVYNTATPAVL